MFIGAPNFPLSPNQVLCQICSLPRNSHKYKRHLYYHMRQGEISSPEIRNILFQTRYTRSNASQKSFSNLCGSICPILVNEIPCSKHVVDLRAHIRKIHKLSPCDNLFIHAINSATVCHKKVFFKRQFVGKLKVNPLEKINRSSDVQSASKRTCRVLELNAVTSDLETDYTSSSSSDDHSSDHSPVKSPNFPSIVRSISLKLDNAILSFKNFLPSQWGGSNSKSAAKVHITNIIFLLNGVGEGQLFDPDTLNSYLSKKRDFGVTPSTLISRLDSLERFYNYLLSHHPDVLPKSLNRPQVSSLIKGVKKSLFKAKNKRQRDIMAKNREYYPQTIAVLKQWRERRKFSGALSLFRDYALDGNMELTEENYTRMRDFLIVEIIVPNGQRPGIIEGMQIGEVERSKFSITADGYHRLIVADHKTGDNCSATLFLYPEIFRAIDIFVTEIIPKLTIMLSAAPLNKKSLVFQKYSGEKLLSSRVTPILRQFLLSMGISFNGTITDLRKAAATLTGKFQPSLQELMAVFMGHSRTAHEKYYKIQMGHQGLSEAFKSLESFQSNPYRDSSSFSPPCTSNISSDTSFDVSGNIHSTLPTSDSENIVPTRDRSSLPVDKQNILYQRRDSFNMELSSQFSTEYIEKGSLEWNNQIVYDKTVKLKHLSIHLNPNISKFYPLQNGNTIQPHKLVHKSPTNNHVLKMCSRPSLRNFHSMKTRSIDGPDRANYRTILHLIFDNILFSSVFKSQIRLVKDHFRISKVEIMDIARKSPQFSPFLSLLNSRFPLTIVERKIMNKVRALGVSHRNSSNVPHVVCSTISCTNTNEFHNTEIVNSEILDKPYTILPTKSIFCSKSDETLFRNVFYDLINRRINNNTVKKEEILKRFHNDERLFHLQERLLSRYSLEAVNAKIVAKVRTLGYSLRNEIWSFLYLEFQHLLWRHEIFKVWLYEGKYMSS